MILVWVLFGTWLLGLAAGLFAKSRTTAFGTYALTFGLWWGSAGLRHCQDFLGEPVPSCLEPYGWIYVLLAGVGLLGYGLIIRPVWKG